MKRLFLLLALLSLAVPAWADDQTREVQQALKDQGFYYGQVDGQGGPETAAAIRRYQIRQGLEVTGKLDQQTLASLNLGADSDNSATAADNAPPPPPPATAHDNQPPKSVVQSDRDFLRNQPESPAPAPAASDDDDTATAQPPPHSLSPGNAAPPGPPAPAVSADDESAQDYLHFFRKTPYESAPPVVQRSTVQRAQMRLAREGFYRGVADGQLSDILSRSLVAYQRYAELAPTGRLDMDTLADMNLLPRRHLAAAPPLPPSGFYGDSPREVYRGIWVH